jgi:hypothetical protein
MKVMTTYEIEREREREGEKKLLKVIFQHLLNETTIKKGKKLCLQVIKKFPTTFTHTYHIIIEICGLKNDHHPTSTNLITKHNNNMNRSRRFLFNLNERLNVGLFSYYHITLHTRESEKN